SVPIVICSATLEKRDAVLGLKLGADDFIAKPFDIYELEARLQAVLRRSKHTPLTEPPRQADQMHVGNLAIERARRRVSVAGKSLSLTPTEYRLLSALADRVDEVVARKDLAAIVWGYEDASSGRTID